MPSMDEFIDIGKSLVEDVGSNFTNPDDDWTMFLMVEVMEGKILMIELPPEWANSDSLKEALAAVLAEYVQHTKLLKIGMISSTWQVAGEGDFEEAMQGRRPSEHPDRFEAVIVVAADPEIQKMTTAKIVRTETEPPVLEPWIEAERVDVAGRLMGPLIQAFR
jgi:hypothetical protein